MKHIVIGTAGHVDHGKTVLVKALTGVDTDRLKEEKERGISIELGFAKLKLPSGHNAAIIDVPGHERFIKNMLAGVGGIDIVMLVVAADEGVMPQTREHLEIIQLLQIDKGVVVITKKDLVDEEWLSLVREELQEFLRGTVLENARVVAVSSVTGEGLDELLHVIDELVAGVDEKKSSGPPRMPVDRVFSVVGFGTVSTGTLLSGQIRPGDNLQVYPGDTVSRVRNIHVHGQKVDMAEAGQRVAVNLSGVETGDIKRGNVLAAPGSLKPSHRLDARMKFLPSAPKPLKHRARVRVYLGTAEILGRVVLLDREELKPGEDAYVQLQLEDPVAAARGDHFVIRSYSPMRTIGGGTVIDPAPVKHKRNRKEVIEALSTAEKGTPSELVEQYLFTTARPVPLHQLATGAGISEEEAGSTLRELLDNDRVVKLTAEGEDYYLSAMVLARWEQTILSVLNEYHQKYPLREGYPKEELRSRYFTVLNAKQFQVLVNYLDQRGKVAGRAQSIALRGFEPQPPPEINEKINRLEKIFLENEFQPPTWSDATTRAGIKNAEAQELLGYLLARGILVKLAEGIYLHGKALRKAVSLIKEHLEQKGEISLGEVRDLLQTSRKYTLPLLEYLDREKVTRRVGDMRVAGKFLT
ncbi:selenocysteine-specific translation elongation factor [Desulfallas sp. Bu1-1]|uniref:selenocysteine-specific translation elongation factor n=1 Tax=Desulfallas sp. Bu1-1 TaxID=2787620 RepID=UPI00189FF08D|nr:selenocysteine-specific translation elongation factor [Desulfallas sp. Bu1-1]MBF7084106.1 selenocysteine-specific translation elongation factor [Desulfallas sp. Bu1-1]